MTNASPLRVGRRSLLISLTLTAVLVVAMTIARVQVTLADPNFDARDARGLLKSDPGLLYYLTERVIESGGRVPDDFGADPRIEHPDTFDVPGKLPVAQEFVVAWCRLAAGDALPLHVFCLWIAGAFASLTLIGVWLLARELSGSAWLALLAAALAAALPASWRTTGFVLMDEDFSLPFFALHLGLVARAARVRTPVSFALAATALGAAVATWHAASFLFGLEAACVLAWVLWSGRNPFAARGALLVPLVLASFGLLVPFLRAGRFVLSGPMLIVFALALSAWLARARTPAAGDGDTAEEASTSSKGTSSKGTSSKGTSSKGTSSKGVSSGSVSSGRESWGGASSSRATSNDGSARRRARATVIASMALLIGVAWLVPSSAGSGDEYGHVFGLLAAKLEHLGALPADPRELSPEVRLMWQGPFATLDLAGAWMFLGLAAFVVPCALAALARAMREGDADPLVIVTIGFACASVAAAWMIQRVVVLPAMLLPAVAAMLASGRPSSVSWLRGRVARIAFPVLIAAQFAVGASWLASYRNPWYAQPRQRQAEIAALVSAIPSLVPPDAAIASDSMNSTAILAHTRRRAVLSPKWESGPSRARVVEYLHAFVSESPAAFRDRLVRRFGCRYVLIDRFTLGYLSSYAAGLPDGVPPPGSAAAVFLSTDAAVLEGVPGYRLLYRSPATILQSNGAPTDFYRLYALSP